MRKCNQSSWRACVLSIAAQAQQPLNMQRVRCECTHVEASTHTQKNAKDSERMLIYLYTWHVWRCIEKRLCTQCRSVLTMMNCVSSCLILNRMLAKLSGRASKWNTVHINADDVFSSLFTKHGSRSCCQTIYLRHARAPRDNKGRRKKNCIPSDNNSLDGHVDTFDSTPYASFIDYNCIPATLGPRRSAIKQIPNTANENIVHTLVRNSNFHDKWTTNPQTREISMEL